MQRVRSPTDEQIGASADSVPYRSTKGMKQRREGSVTEAAGETRGKLFRLRSNRLLNHAGTV